MFKKIRPFLVLGIFAMGLVVGSLSGALYYSSMYSRIEATALTYAIADSTITLVPMLLGFGENNLDTRISILELSARRQMTIGIVAMHINLPIVEDGKRKRILGVLRSIAEKREKLKLGKFAEPPREDIEEILVSYTRDTTKKS